MSVKPDSDRSAGLGQNRGQAGSDSEVMYLVTFENIKYFSSSCRDRYDGHLLLLDSPT